MVSVNLLIYDDDSKAKEGDVVVSEAGATGNAEESSMCLAISKFSYYIHSVLANKNQETTFHYHAIATECRLRHLQVILRTLGGF